MDINEKELHVDKENTHDYMMYITRYIYRYIKIFALIVKRLYKACYIALSIEISGFSVQQLLYALSIKGQNSANTRDDILSRVCFC